MKKAEENNRSAGSGLKRSLEIMRQTFEKPQMQAAIANLAQSLPQLAEAASKAIAWIAKNPLTAAGVLTGGTFAKGALSSILSRMLAGGAGTGQAMAGMATSATTASTSLSALAMAAAPAAAALAAVVSVGYAIDQAAGLINDLKHYDPKQAEQDIVDQNENLLQVAERRGAAFATKEVSEFYGPLEVMTTKFIERDAVTGKAVERDSPTLGQLPKADPTPPGWQGPLSDYQLAQRYARDPSAMNVGGVGSGSGGPVEAKVDPAALAASARASAEAMAQQKLRVHVTNASELRSSIGKGGPRPGYSAGD
jgi:hypothetical protein